MQSGTCGACSGSKREWVWRKLGACLGCMRLSWWGMLLGWLGFAAALGLAMPAMVYLPMGLVALALSLFWLVHWGAFVGKNLATVAAWGQADRLALSRRQLFRLALQQAIAAIVLVCKGDSFVSAQDKPGCGPITVPVAGEGLGDNSEAACNNARADWLAKANAVGQDCMRRCRLNDAFCQGGECVCVGVTFPVELRCTPARIPDGQRWKCTCTGNVVIRCRCLGAACGTLGNVLVIGGEQCDESRQRARTLALGALSKRAHELCTQFCQGRACFGGLRCVCSSAKLVAEADCRERQIPDPNRPGRTIWCVRCTGVYSLHCRCV